MSSQLTQSLQSLREQTAFLSGLLRDCRDQFATYELSHRAKEETAPNSLLKADAKRKADVNALMVARIDAAISRQFTDED